MGNLTHAAGRLAVSKVSDVVLKNLDKDREKEIVKLVDFMEKYMDGEKLDINYEKARTMITDKNGALNHYINRLLDEVDRACLVSAETARPVPAPGGKEDDWNLGIGLTNLLGQGESVFLGHHHVENGDVELALGKLSVADLTILAENCLITFGL